MADETKTKKEAATARTIVVKELPTQAFNKGKDEEGNDFNLLTIEEAVTVILEKLTKIEKAVA